jgi:hypothetical protein
VLGGWKKAFVPEMRGAAPWSRPMVKAPGMFEYADGLAIVILLEYRWRDGSAKMSTVELSLASFGGC